jgi:hypothetical protein
MENKTAVERLIDQYEEKAGTLLLLTFKELMKKEIEQALELEKLQIIEAYQWGRTDQNSKEKKWYNRNALIYYSETYKKPTE